MRAVLTVLLLFVLAFPAQQTLAQSPAGATLNWGEDRDYRTLDPRVTQSRHEWQVIMHVFDSLIFRDADGKFHPWLAESWQFSPDRRSITFKLRKGVTFHDGTPFNAEAVKFTFDSIQDPAVGSQAAIDLLGPYKSSEVVDPYTIRVNWNQPYGPIIANLSTANLGIVSPAAVKKLGNDGFARAPVGSGPLKFVEWVDRQRVVLDRNPAYKWAPAALKNKGAVQFERVVLRIIPDDSTRVAAFERREIDLIESIPAIEVKRFRGAANTDVMLGLVTGLPESVMFNISVAPTNDVRVRRAFMHAVNRPKLVQDLFYGTKKPAYSAITESTPGYWKGAEALYPYDLNRAKALLEEAGWKVGAGGIREKDGQKLEMNFRVLVFPDVAVALQSSVREAGMQLNVENVTKPKQDEYILANDYHVLTLSWSGADPSILSIPFHSRNVPEPGKFKFNWNRIKSQALDRLLTDADGETDPAKRARILQSIQQFVLNQGLMFPMHPLVQATGYYKNISGLRFAQTQYQVIFNDVRVGRR
ncbi:MAG: ABC transporter substrate-binding protein [Armatimonadetes bacterium]|nr:ABC transporter substrate-binding protein [Armatimonadota bacterium]